MLPQDIIHGLAFEANNPIWKSVHKLLDASIEVETDTAISREVKGEDRAWHCGRADALKAFKQVLMNTRNDVLRDIGRPSEEHNPSEIGS
jgi:hypothetical protein